MTLNIQRFLATHTLNELETTKHVHNSIVGDLVLLNYDHIDSPKDDPIANECRGLILRNGTWDVVARSFTRFFNAGDPACAHIDWQTARATEKVDGSLLTIFHDGRAWRISTRGSVDAAGTLPYDPERTFADVIWPLIDTRSLCADYCYACEFVSPWNRIVKRYDVTALYLLTIRDLCAGWMEISADELLSIAELQGWRIPESFSVSGMGDVTAAIEKLGPQDEGYVVVDGSHNRIKIKSVSYVELHKIVNNGCPDYWRLIVRKEDDDICSMFPEFTSKFELRKSILGRSLDSAHEAWIDNKYAIDQKSFALSVKSHPLSAILFQMRKNLFDGTVREYLETMDEDVAVRLLENKFEEEARKGTADSQSTSKGDK